MLRKLCIFQRDGSYVFLILLEKRTIAEFSWERGYFRSVILSFDKPSVRLAHLPLSFQIHPRMWYLIASPVARRKCCHVLSWSSFNAIQAYLTWDMVHRPHCISSKQIHRSFVKLCELSSDHWSILVQNKLQESSRLFDWQAFPDF